VNEHALLWAGLRTTLISHGFTPPIPASCYAPFSKWTKLDDQTLILSVALVLLNRKRRCKDRKSGLSETFPERVGICRKLIGRAPVWGAIKVACKPEDGGHASKFPLPAISGYARAFPLPIIDSRRSIKM